MALEVLRAKLQAAGNLKRELGLTATAARNAGDEFDELSDEANTAGVSAAVFAEGLDEAAAEAASLAQREAIATQQTESLGDEMIQTALQAGVLEEALDDAAGSGSGFSAEIGGINGRLSRIAALAAAAAPPLLGLGAALGGIGVGAGTIGVGVLGISAAGIQARAEETAALSSELENAAEAREQILGDFKSRLGDAFEPLQNAQAEQFAFDNLEAVVSIAENASESLLRLQDTVINIGSAFRRTLVDVSGEVFTELAIQAERLSPLILQLQGVLRDLPGLIRLLGDAAVRIGPELFNTFAALGRITAGLTEFGIALLDILLPPLNAVLGAFAFVADLFRSLPESVQLGVAAFVAITAAVAAFGTVTSVAASAVLALTAPISLTALAVAGLTAGIVILLSELGLLGSILSFISNPLAGFSNLLDGIAGSVGDLLPDIKILNDILNAVGLNAEDANDNLNDLDPSDGNPDGDTESESGSSSEPSGLVAGGVAAGAILGGAAGTIVGPGPGTVGGAALGATAGGAIGAEAEKNDALRGFLGGGITGTAVGTALGAGVGTFVLPGVGTAAGAAVGGALGGTVLGTLGAASEINSAGSGDETVDASGSGDGGRQRGSNGESQDAKTEINVTVKGVDDPARMRDAVRRGVEAADRRKRNSESGRVD